MSKKENINIFDIAPPDIKYSRYAQSLNRVFKTNSLESLQYNLKFPNTNKLGEIILKSKKNKFKINERLPNLKTKDFTKKNHEIEHIIPREHHTNSKLLHKSSLISNPTINHKNIITEPNTNNEDITKNSRNKHKLNNSNEICQFPGKYNPNYDSILKRVPVAKIMPKAVKPTQERNKNINTSVYATSVIHTENISENLSVILNEKGKEYNHLRTESCHTISGAKNELHDDKKSNKNTINVMRFSKYSKRKSLDSNKWVLPIISYVNPNIAKDTQKILIDFNKMKNRNKNDSTNNLASNPSICYYEPNFNYVRKNTSKNVQFKITKNLNKSYLVKKIWTNYDVSCDYQTIKLKNFMEELPQEGINHRK